MTRQATAVAVALMDDPSSPHWGYPLSKGSGVSSGVLYPILSRMLDEGWLRDGWEEGGLAAEAKRPPRRYYTITTKGMLALGAMVSNARESQEFSGIAIPSGAT